MSRVTLFIALICSGIFSGLSRAETVTVAVAANFYKPMLALAQQFEQQTQHKVQLSAGSTGALFAQIQHGAPFDVLLAADPIRPQALVEQGLGIANSQFTYAQGRLALWSAAEDAIDQAGKALKQHQHLSRVAIANPKTAPYGAAAVEFLKRQHLFSSLAHKLVQGQNISQTFQYINSGLAPIGFIALSQVYEQNQLKSGSIWIIPTSLYSPLNQGAVLLNQGATNPAAKALLHYLKSKSAQAMIRAFGYQI